MVIAKDVQEATNILNVIQVNIEDTLTHISYNVLTAKSCSKTELND